MGSALNVLADSLSRRFANYFCLGEGSHDAVVAAMSHPAVKLKWLKPLCVATGKTDGDMLQIFKQYVADNNLYTPETDVQAESPTTSQYCQIFDFGDDSHEGK